MAFGLQQGTIFAGRYRVLGRIAIGGMGAVYEVLHLETERRRALKVMLPHMIQSPELRDRFKREAKVAAKVDSEFIVDVFDAGVDEATQMPFLVMELLRGEELGKRLKRQGRLSAVEVVTYLQQTAMALDKTHQAAIVHRDLKPDNLFLTFREDGQPRIKVLDFGVAKVIAESGTATGGTRSLGTPIYMSPEQFNPEIRLTGAADIYALGMIAYTLLVGAPYWDVESRSGNMITFALVAVKGPPEAASTRAGRHGVQLSPAFDTWFARACATDPAHRFPKATSGVAALAEALGLPAPRASFSLEQGVGLQSEPPQSSMRLAAALTSGVLTSAGMPTPTSSPAPTSLPTPMSSPTPVSALTRKGRPALTVAIAAVGVTVLGGGAVALSRFNKPSLGAAESGEAGLAAPALAGSAPASTAREAAPMIEPVATPEAPSRSAVVATPGATVSVPLKTPSLAGKVAGAASAKTTPSGKGASATPAVATPAPKKKASLFGQD